MSVPRVLIAGIGNIFFGDDAFGVEVVRRLQRVDLPGEVRVVDFGIRGIDLTYALLDGYETVILVDAVSRGGEPGTLFVIEPEEGDLHDVPPATPMLNAHDLDPAKVLKVASSLGGRARNVLLVGCEPANVGGGDQIPGGLSRPVADAVDRAVDLIRSLLEKEPLGEPNSSGR